MVPLHGGSLTPFRRGENRRGEVCPCASRGEGDARLPMLRPCLGAPVLKEIHTLPSACMPISLTPEDEGTQSSNSLRAEARLALPKRKQSGDGEVKKGDE